MITGASSGIGRASAIYMDRLGWKVFAGVRKKQDAKSLRSAGSSRLTPVFLDVSKTGDVRKAVRFVEQATGTAGLAGLVNNAGVPYGGPVEFLELDEIRRAFDVNFFGVIAVTQAFIPLLRRAQGRIVNIGSISGLIASPFLSSYSTSKFALEALSDTLRVELHPWKIQVSLIEPGAVNTPIWDKAVQLSHEIIDDAPPAWLQLYGKVAKPWQSSLGPHGISPDVAAKAVAHALTSRYPRTRYRLGLDALGVGILRLLPDRLRDRFFLARFPEWR